MGIIKDYLKRIKKLANRPHRTSNPVYKLMEEVGEYAETVNVEDCGMNKKVKETSEQEAGDVVILALENFFWRGGTIETLLERLESKVTRWEERHKEHLLKIKKQKKFYEPPRPPEPIEDIPGKNGI